MSRDMRDICPDTSQSALEGIRTPNLLIRSRRPPVARWLRWSLTVRFYAQIRDRSPQLCHRIPQCFSGVLANC